VTAAVPEPGTDLPVGPKVDASPAQRPGPVVLEGRFGRIEKLNAARHGEGLWAAVRGHDRIWTYLGYGPFADRATFDAWLADRPQLEDPYSYAIIDAGGQALGIATLMEIRPAMRVIEVGNIVYGAPLQRTALATEAQFLLARYVFETLGYRRYEWKCNALNAPSRRAAARFGFIYEGLFRHHMIVKGRNRDTAWFAMLDSEWPARKRAFERWLAPENFAADGGQKVSLAALNGATGPGGLRRAGPTDLAAITELQRAAYARNRKLLGVEPLPLLADYAQVLADYEVWLLEEADELAGVLILEPRREDMLIWSVAASPGRQGVGLGNRLLAAAEERARALGLPLMRLYTGDKLAGNIAWYERHGFVQERVEELSDRRIVHMKKPIG
jgi:RimJ/RimL family protein N-acetyltransferase/ribosomal protein S18 acetylase RimI-like enzyme